MSFECAECKEYVAGVGLDGSQWCVVCAPFVISHERQRADLATTALIAAREHHIETWRFIDGLIEALSEDYSECGTGSVSLAIRALLKRRPK